MRFLIHNPLAKILTFAFVFSISTVLADESTQTPIAIPDIVSKMPAKAPPLAMSVTVSSGVSLGAYQAGYLFYLSEVAKMNDNLLDLRMVTGASAGMVNTLITVLAMGNEYGDEPAETLFYKTWTEMRYDELLDVEQAPPLALSSRRVFEKLGDQIEEKWNQGLSEDLDMVLGAAAMRVKGHPIEVSEGLELERTEEKFVFRVRGRGPGREPYVENYIDRLFGSHQPLLPFVDVEKSDREQKRTNFSVIRQLLFASCAIPLMFPPQEIGYCLTSPKQTTKLNLSTLRICPHPQFREKFVDGSLADRKPLRLAYRIAASGLIKAEDTGEIVWRDMPDLKDIDPEEDVVFLYVDPERRTYPTGAEKKSNKKSIDRAVRFFPAFGDFMRSYLKSARTKEMSTLIDEHPEVSDRLKLATHDFPTISGQLFNFFGFFDREFRKFDFYLGVRDARRFVEQKLFSKMHTGGKGENADLVFPEPEKLARKNIAATASWRPYFCLRAVIDGKKEYQAACDSESLRDFRIILQTTLDRLYDHCRMLPYDETLEHIHCKRAMAQERPPTIWRMEGNGEDWKRLREYDESELEHTMRLLEVYGFHFRDLGLDRDEASLGMSRIRANILRYVDEFAKKLRGGERLAVRVLGKPAVNFFAYAPPETIIYLVAGKGAEIAVSATLGQSYWLRYNFALYLQGFSSLLTEDQNVFSATSVVGLEAEIYPMSSPLFQTRLGLRVGYQFSTDDGFLKRACETGDFRSSSLRCSAPLAQAFLAVSFYERVRLQAGVEWFPRWLPPMDEFGHDVWNGMIEVGWQWISPF